MKKFGKGLVIGYLVLAALTVGGKYLLFPRYEKLETTGDYAICLWPLRFWPVCWIREKARSTREHN